MELEETPSAYSYLIGEKVEPFPGWFGRVTAAKDDMVQVAFWPWVEGCIGTYRGEFIEESLTAPLPKPTQLEKPVEIEIGTKVKILEGGNPDRIRIGKVTERIRERVSTNTWGEDSLLDTTPYNIYRVEFPFNEKTKSFDGPYGSPSWEYGGKFLQDKIIQDR